MATGKQPAGGLEWKVTVPEGASARLEAEPGTGRRRLSALPWLILAVWSKVSGFFAKAWKVGVEDPRKVVHGLKVGLALALVSLFYYTRPLYDGVGGAAMWAVMTVVVVFEFTVGGTLYKGFNRVLATLLGGALGAGISALADVSGDKGEPVVLDASLFLLASAATFSRFIPKVKALFDYGITIFILTYSLVSVSSYRVDGLVELAQQRLATIAIGCSICLVICVVIRPVWAGEDLHLLVLRNMDKMATSIEGSIGDYFNEDSGEGGGKPSQRSQDDYKCVLNSKASEESLANLARWEPAHGRFSFRHPWKQYLVVGAALRRCACCVEVLHGILSSQLLGQEPEFLKQHLSGPCTEVSSQASKVLRELAESVKTMTRSGSIDFLLGEMNGAVEDLHGAWRCLPSQLPAVAPPAAVEAGAESGERGPAISRAPSCAAVIYVGALPLVTIAALLAELSTRIESVADAVDTLSDLAMFAPASDEKPEKADPPTSCSQDAAKAVQMV